MNSEYTKTPLLQIVADPVCQSGEWIDPPLHSEAVKVV
jgi:hypothetical protein